MFFSIRARPKIFPFIQGTAQHIFFHPGHSPSYFLLSRAQPKIFAFITGLFENIFFTPARRKIFSFILGVAQNIFFYPGHDPKFFLSSRSRPKIFSFIPKTWPEHCPNTARTRGLLLFAQV